LVGVLWRWVPESAALPLTVCSVVASLLFTFSLVPGLLVLVTWVLEPAVFPLASATIVTFFGFSLHARARSVTPGCLRPPSCIVKFPATPSYPSFRRLFAILDFLKPPTAGTIWSSTMVPLGYGLRVRLRLRWALRLELSMRVRSSTPGELFELLVRCCLGSNVLEFHLAFPWSVSTPFLRCMLGCWYNPRCLLRRWLVCRSVRLGWGSLFDVRLFESCCIPE